jgi:hypothetical protein
VTPPKFKPNDPVWVSRSKQVPVNSQIPPGLNPRGETAAVVLGSWILLKSHYYALDICGNDWSFAEVLLRPRRDDYQQREGLSTRGRLNKILYMKDPQLAKIGAMATEISL